jgi:hypothetical protein
MRFDGRPRRRPLLRALIAVSLVTAPVLISGTAHAQTSLLGLTKSVSLSPPEVAPAQQFTYFLSYSCSSLTTDCVGAKIVDVLPPQLSHLITDVKLAGNFKSATYDANTGTATFILFDPLPAGTTAQVSISAQFPPGTAPGTTAQNFGTMTATNAPPVTSNKVIVTAKAASKWTVTKGLSPGSIAQLDTPFTYRVALTLAAGGTQNLDNVRFVDTLPAGAEFVSATGGGTFNATTNQVTWTAGNMVADLNKDVTVFREVTVIFRSPTFKAGDNPLNVVDAFGAPTGEPDQLLGHGERQVTLKPFGNVTAGSKKDTTPDLGPGQTDTYTLTAENPTAGPLSGFQVIEDLPPQLSMVQDGQPNLTGTGPPPTITATPGGPVPVAGGGGGWSATAPAAADTLLFDFGTVPAAFTTTIQVRAGIPSNGVGRDGQPVVGGTTFQNCVDITAVGASKRHACTTQNVVPLAVNFSKILTSPSVSAPGQIVSWEITVNVPVTSATNLLNPSLNDCLPLGFDLVDPTNPANPINGSVTGVNLQPVIVRTPNGCGGNRTLIRWFWPGTFTVVKAQTGVFKLNTLVADDAPPASQENQVSLSGTNLPIPLLRVAPIAVTSATILVGHKEVKGDRDTDFLSFPNVGNTTRGGTAVYRSTIRNVSDVAVTKVIVVDTFPIPGDIGIKDFTPRDSHWQPLFGDQIQAPQAVAVWYSTQHNPCRADLTITAPGCQPANWTTTPPSPLSSVGAIKVEYGDLVLSPNQSLSFTWLMNTPPNAPVGAVAWNSFGYTATRVDNGSQLDSAEPTKVGLQVEAPPGPRPPPPGPPLPPTGSDTNVLAVISVLLLVGGAVLVRLARRPTAPARTG